MKTRGKREAAGVSAVVALLAACNGLTGAGEPEVVEDASGTGSGLATSASATTSDASTSAGSSVGGADGGGGREDLDSSGTGVPPCGDGDLAKPEECDDGNVEDDDGCSAVCQLECAEGEAKRLSVGTCLATSDPDDRRTWDDAQGACVAAGGGLWLLTDLDLGPLNGRFDGRLFVGAMRAEDGAFEWTDGSPLDTDLVAVGDEDDADCVAITATPKDDRLLVSVPCDDRLPYVCERDPAADT